MSAYPASAITGIILAGGRAERMGGCDKGLLPLAGRPMAAHVLGALRPQVGELIINANRNLEAYRALGCRVLSDGVGEFCGPLAGMLAALEAATTPLLITVPCDSPLLPGDYVQRMYEILEGANAEIAVAAGGGRLQPVFALLRNGLRASLRVRLEAGERKIDRWFARHRMIVTDFSDHPEMFRNINTPADLVELERDMEKTGAAGTR